MSKHTPPNGIRIGDDGREAFIERHQDGYADIAIILDATNSRSESIGRIKRDFHAQMEKLSTVALDKLRLSIYSYGGGTEDYPPNDNGGASVSDAIFHGTFTSFEEAANAVDRIQCRRGLTGIYNTLVDLGQHQEDKTISKLDAVILYGDTVDELEQSRLATILEAAKKLKVPIVSFLERTEGTQEFRDTNALKTISESTGVKGCPIDYEYENSQVGFADFVRAIAAATQGPNAVAALKETNEIPDYVWGMLPEETLKTVSEPEPAAEPKDEPLAKEPRRVSLLTNLISGAMNGATVLGAFAVAIMLSQQLEKETAVNEPVTIPVAPPADKVTQEDLTTSFDNTGTFVFDDNRYQEAFPSGAAIMAPAFAGNVDVLGQYIQENPQVCDSLEVSGFTDPRGSESFNMSLSQQRADAVKTYLSEQFDIQIPIITIPKGETELLNPGQTGAEIYAKERRIAVACVRSGPE